MAKINVAAYLLLSALVVLAKAEVEYDNDGDEYQSVDGPSPAVDQAQSVAYEALFKPNKKLQRAEAKLTEEERELVERGQVREALEGAVHDLLENPEVAQHVREAEQLWKAALSGPEAMRLTDALGEAARRVMTSPVSSQSVAMLSTVARMLLQKLGEINQGHETAGTVDAAIRLLTAPELPGVVQKGGEAVVKMVTKPGLVACERTMFAETKKLLNEPNFVKRLDIYLDNLEAMMAASTANATAANRVH